MELSAVVIMCLNSAPKSAQVLPSCCLVLHLQCVLFLDVVLVAQPSGRRSTGEQNVGRTTCNTMCCIKTETNFEQNYLALGSHQKERTTQLKTFLNIATCNHMVDAVGQVWKKMPAVYDKGKGELLCTGSWSSWKSSATQTQFGIF